MLETEPGKASVQTSLFTGANIESHGKGLGVDSAKVFVSCDLSPEGSRAGDEHLKT